MQFYLIRKLFCFDINCSFQDLFGELTNFCFSLFLSLTHSPSFIVPPFSVLCIHNNSLHKVVLIEKRNSRNFLAYAIFFLFFYYFFCEKSVL